MIQPCFPSMMPESSWRPPDSFPDISRAKWWSIDIESSDKNLRTRGPGFMRKDAFVAGVGIHVDGFNGYYPVRHLQGANLAPNVVFEWLADEARHFHGEINGANLLYDLEGLWHEGVKFNDDCKYRDIQIAEPVINEELFGGCDVESLSNKYLRESKKEELLREAASRHTKTWKDKRAKRPIEFDAKKDLWMLDPAFVGAYVEGDVDLPRRIFNEHQRCLLEKDDLWDIFELECSLIPILLKMRIHGVRVDLERAEELKRLMTVEIDKYSYQITKLVGFDPNVDSNQDMLRAYETLNDRYPEMDPVQIKYTKPTKNYPYGQASFVADWYNGQDDPLSHIVLKKKKLMTMRDDFVVGDIINEHINGRIHCQFHQLRSQDNGTRTARFSSTNPNLQQVPARHDEELWGVGSPEWSKEVRKLFVPDEGKRWFKGDYSGQEPRLLVHFAASAKCTGADVAVEAFIRNPRTDYHQLTADIVNEKSGRQPPFKRKSVKDINLGIFYGIGLPKLCKKLKVSVEEGVSILAAYHSAIPFVKELSKKVIGVAEERGFILTLLKRKCHFDLWEPVPDRGENREFKVTGLPRTAAEASWPNRRLQRSGTHKSLNRLLQTSAADQTKKAMHDLYYNYGICPQLQVHDELNGSVANIEEARTYKRTMETCVKLRIPSICDGAVGDSWGNAKEPVEYAEAA